MNSSNWAIGESVVVKAGVTDPDTGRALGGWQGRISAILDEVKLPLCDLKATEADTETRQLVEDYCTGYVRRVTHDEIADVVG